MLFEITHTHTHTNSSYTLSEKRYERCHWDCGKLLSILGTNMYILGADMYIYMYILGADMYILGICTF